jgi:hypothetical protein
MQISEQIKSAHLRLLLQDTHRGASKEVILEVIYVSHFRVAGVPTSNFSNLQKNASTNTSSKRKAREQLQIKHLHLICSIVTVASCNISLAFLSGVQPARSISL